MTFDQLSSTDEEEFMDEGDPGGRNEFPAKVDEVCTGQQRLLKQFNEVLTSSSLASERSVGEKSGTRMFPVWETRTFPEGMS